ncbi:MAG: DUF2092 domain-containing protein [Pseudoxanthomonas sp.]
MTISFLEHKGLRIAICAAALAVAGVGSAQGQEADGAGPAADEAAILETGGVVTAEAQAVLDRMEATFNGLKNYGVTADITRDEVLPFGYKLQNNESARMWVQAPKRLRLEVEGDIKNRTYVYDGSELTMFAPDLNVYATTAAPDTLGELVRVLLDAGVEMPLIDFLYQGNTGNLTEAVRVGLLVGDSEVDGVPTDHLAFRQADIDWQLWVEKGSRALPRKLVITTRYEVGDPQYQAVLHWDLNPRTGAKTFGFVPPAGATRIPFHNKLVADGGDE